MSSLPVAVLKPVNRFTVSAHSHWKAGKSVRQWFGGMLENTILSTCNEMAGARRMNEADASNAVMFMVGWGFTDVRIEELR